MLNINEISAGLDRGQLRRFEDLIHKNLKQQRALSENDRWLLIQGILIQDGYMSGVDRMSDRVDATGEVFTPAWLAIKSLKEAGVASFAKGKKCLEPACGDGQLLIAMMLGKVFFHKMTCQEALSEIWGLDIMLDNLDRCKARIKRITKMLDMPVKELTLHSHLLHGNYLSPETRLDKEGQSEDEYEAVKALFKDRPKQEINH